MMIANILSCERLDLYLNINYVLNENELAKLRDYVKRRAKREPLQYILGEVNFFGHKLKIDSRALIPRPETELLVNLIIENVKETDKVLNVLEVGTGSGCIAISLAKKFPQFRFTAIDISQDAVSLAIENASLHEIRNINFLVADFFRYEPKEKFNIIVSNPPYVIETDLDKLQEELKYEPRIALTAGEDSIAFYKRFVKFIDYLEDNGKMYLEINEKNSQEVTKLFNKLSIVKLKKDYFNLDRILLYEKSQKYNE